MTFSRKCLVFLVENLKRKHYFDVVSTRLFFHVTVSSLEHRHKKQENVLMTIFRNTKGRHEKLEVFFQIVFFMKYLRRSLYLIEL